MLFCFGIRVCWNIFSILFSSVQSVMGQIMGKDWNAVLSRRHDWRYHTLTNISYHREGDNLIPYLLPPESPRIGIWSQRHLHYLKDHRKPIYTGLLLSGKLNAHLEEIDRSASEMYDLLMKQYAEREGVTEQLKAENQMEWVRKMNGIRNCVTEIVLRDQINI